MIYNVFTPIRTEERIDYYGVPYTATVIGHAKTDYGKLWKEFVSRRDAEIRRLETYAPAAAGGFTPPNIEDLNKYYELELMKHEQ
jgi:hypothetical protein